MSEMLVPFVNSYFAIYTLENGAPHDWAEMPAGRAARGMNWDLHATATDRTLAISHARMLAMQPGVTEVHVKEVRENLQSGLVHVRDIKRCRKGHYLKSVQAYGWHLATAAVALAALVALLVA